jgi:hypothetical protein
MENYYYEQLSLFEKTKDNAKKVNKYIKASTIANKAVSLMFGYKKTLKKSQMNPEMILKRQEIMDRTLALIIAQEMGIHIPSISTHIYEYIYTDTV